MFYIVKYNEEDAAIYYDEDVVKETGEKYFSIESIPEGSGVLKTDGISKVWWEEIPEPEPEPEPMPTDHEILMTLLGVTE